MAVEMVTRDPVAPGRLMPLYSSLCLIAAAWSVSSVGIACEAHHNAHVQIAVKLCRARNCHVHPCRTSQTHLEKCGKLAVRPRFHRPLMPGACEKEQEEQKENGDESGTRKPF